MKEKIIELLDNDEFEFAFDLVKGSEDFDFFESFLDEATIEDGYLCLPDWVGWEGIRKCFFLKVLQCSPEYELKRKILEKTKYLEIHFLNNELFPNEVLQFTNLVYLHLRGGKYKSLPPEIKRLHTLTDFNLQSVGLVELPQELSELKMLRRLDLPGNKLSGNSANLQVISQLKLLELLVLNSNDLQEIPSFIIPHLQKLKSISLNFNKFSSEGLTKIISELSELPELREVFLSGCKIDRVPHVNNGFKKLVKLDLGENNISNLPDYFSKLPNLKWLVLKGNPVYEDGSFKSNDRLKYEYESWVYNK